MNVADAGPTAPAAHVLQPLRRNLRATTGIALVLLFVSVALLAPVLAPHSLTRGDLSRIRPGFVPGPSATHPLGLDQQGRDELSRLVYGARSSLLVAVLAVSIGAVAGGVAGAVAGALGGLADAVIMRLMDVMLAVPGLLFAVGLAALLGASLPAVTLAIGAGGVPVVARLTRASILGEREKRYVEAARAAGATPRRVVVRHMLPNAAGPVLAATTVACGGAVLTAAGLAFLGLGPNDPSIPEWGRMLAEGQGLLETSPQLVFFPGAAIVLTVLGFTLLGDALRDAMDPKSKLLTRDPARLPSPPRRSFFGRSWIPLGRGRSRTLHWMTSAPGTEDRPNANGDSAIGN